MSKARDSIEDLKTIDANLAAKAPIASPVFTGNVGVGVTPESWSSNNQALQIGSGGVLYSHVSNATRVSLQGNAYVNSSNADAYITTNEASQHLQEDGTHLFKVAASGSADAAISWNTAMTIDNAGRVTKPLQPMCVVARASNAGAGTIVWDYVYHNVGGHYNTANGRFTAPIAGNYMVGFYAMSPATNITMDVSLFKNGSVNDQLSPYSGATGGGYNALSGYTIITLAANDYVQIRAGVGIYGTNTGRHSNFTVALLS